MKHKYEKLLAACDSDIRSGKPQNVSKRLKSLNVSSVPREWRLPLANICRRAGVYGLGLTLLRRLVLAENRGAAILPTPAERAGYAMLLLKNGAVPEAIDMLNQIKVTEVPEALLYKARAHFIRWEYRAAIPALEEYLRADLKPYDRLVANGNLAFALGEIRETEKALRLHTDNIRAAKESGNWQLASTCHALCAQLRMQSNDYDGAAAELTFARQLFQPTQGGDHFIVTKWSLIHDGLSNNTVEPFERLTTLAIEFRNWEAWREADFYRLKVKFDRARFIHLYFGSPYTEFREFMEKEITDRPTQKFYVYGSKQSPRMDLFNGEIDGRHAINPGKKCHALIEVLLRDFYQPLNIASLHSALFPHDRFDIATSPGKIRQIMWRTRAWLETNEIPAQIEEAHGFYSLVLTGDFSFRVPLSRQTVEPFNHILDKIVREFGGREFFRRDVEKKLDLPKSTVRAILQTGIDKGLITRAGESSRSASYRATTVAGPLPKRAA